MRVIVSNLAFSAEAFASALAGLGGGDGMAVFTADTSVLSGSLTACWACGVSTKAAIKVSQIMMRLSCRAHSCGPLHPGNRSSCPSAPPALPVLRGQYLCPSRIPRLVVCPRHLYSQPLENAGAFWRK